jgi:hypothetical protein
MANYDAHFFDDPIPLLRKASLYLPNNTYQDPVPASPALNALADGSAYAAMNRQVWPANAINTGIDLKEEHYAQTRYTITPVTRVGHQAYFLPWHGSGCATEMTLPNPPAANYFFTSALAGCSVIVTNTLQNPTIYHCGIDAANWGGDGRPARPANIPGFWRGMVNHLEGARVGGARAIIGEVNKELYVTDPNVTYTYPTMAYRGPQETTQPAVDCMNNILDDYVTLVPPGSNNRVQGGEASPWGTFFGVYNAVAGQWGFYLQENLLIKHDGKRVTGLFKAIRRKNNPVYTRSLKQSLPWRYRVVHVVLLAVGAPVFTARSWDWDDVKDGNLWL